MDTIESESGKSPVKIQSYVAMASKEYLAKLASKGSGTLQPLFWGRKQRDAALRKLTVFTTTHCI